MRLVVFADLHLHNFKPHSRPVGGGLNSRALECLRVLEEIRDICAEDDSTVCCFCGDFFHTRSYVYTALVLAARRVLEGWPCPLVMIGGDHDASTNEPGGPSALDIFGDVAIVAPSEGGLLYQDDGVQVVGFPHGASLQPLTRIAKKANRLHKKSPGVKRVLLLHTTIAGTKISPYWSAETGLEMAELADYMNRNGIDQACIGNIHLRQQLEPGIWYVGNCIQQSFGEDQEKGVLVWDTATPQPRFRPVASPQFITVKSLGEISPDDGNYYRVAPETREGYLEAREAAPPNVVVLPVAAVKERRLDLGLDATVGRAVEAYLRHTGRRGAEKKRLRLLAGEFLELGGGEEAK